jgi:protein-disulfide isomerase
MGFFTDVVVVDQKEAKRVARHDNPTEKWPGCSCKNLSEVDFATLYGILIEDPDVQVDLIEVSITDDGVMVSRFPEAYVERLAKLDAVALSNAAVKWQKTEYLNGLVQVTDLEEILKEVATFAKKAKAEGKWLLLSTAG